MAHYLEQEREGQYQETASADSLYYALSRKSLDNGKVVEGMKMAANQSTYVAVRPRRLRKIIGIGFGHEDSEK